MRANEAITYVKALKPFILGLTNKKKQKSFWVFKVCKIFQLNHIKVFGLRPFQTIYLKA